MIIMPYESCMTPVIHGQLKVLNHGISMSLHEHPMDNLSQDPSCQSCVVVARDISHVVPE